MSYSEEKEMVLSCELSKGARGFDHKERSGWWWRGCGHILSALHLHQLFLWRPVSSRLDIFIIKRFPEKYGPGVWLKRTTKFCGFDGGGEWGYLPLGGLNRRGATAHKSYLRPPTRQGLFLPTNWWCRSTQRLIVHTEGEELKTGPQPVRETVFSTEICSVDTDQQENGATILFDDIGKIIFQ